MKVSVHNLIPSFSYLISCIIGIFISFQFFSDLEKIESDLKILTIILLITILSILIVLSYYLKFIIFYDTKISIIRPFRFQFYSFKYHEIKDIEWDILAVDRLADYRRLTIYTDNFKINFSDFEYMNFNSLEKILLEKTKSILKYNLANKRRIELEQAKSNRWFNLIWILMLTYFLVHFTLNTKHNLHIIQITLIIIIYRMIVVLVEYQKRIRGHKLKRRRRRK